MGYEGDGWLEDKNWFRRHWAISIFLGLFLIGIIGIITEDDDSGMTGNVVDTQDYDLEIDIYELLDEFDVLTKLQQEEKVEELKGKRIKTSLGEAPKTKLSLFALSLPPKTFNPLDVTNSRKLTITKIIKDTLKIYLISTTFIQKTSVFPAIG